MQRIIYMWPFELMTGHIALCVTVAQTMVTSLSRFNFFGQPLSVIKQKADPVNVCIFFGVHNTRALCKCGSRAIIARSMWPFRDSIRMQLVVSGGIFRFGCLFMLKGRWRFRNQKLLARRLWSKGLWLIGFRQCGFACENFMKKCMDRLRSLRCEVVVEFLV